MRRRIKILFLIDELLVGGTEKQLVLLAENLPGDRFEPIISVLRKADYQNTLKSNIPVTCFNWSGPRLLKNFSLLWKLVQYIHKENFDIIQTQFADATIYGTWAARICRPRPSLISTRRNLYHWADEDPWAFRFLRHTVRWTDRVLVNSYRVFEQCQTVEKIPPEKIALIQNAVEVDKFNGMSSEAAKRSIGLLGKYPVIGVVSNLRPVKGLVSFLEAATRVSREIPSARFALVGSGPQENDLESLAQALGIHDKVTFLKNAHDIPSVMAAFDIVVQPSLCESFSNVLLEYMAAKKPIVATKVGDAEMVIEDGKNGLLVLPGNPQELATAILYLCRNLEKAATMGRLARQKVAANWSLGKILESYRLFYEELVHQKMRKRN